MLSAVVAKQTQSCCLQHWADTYFQRFSGDCYYQFIPLDYQSWILRLNLQVTLT